MTSPPPPSSTVRAIESEGKNPDCPVEPSCKRDDRLQCTSKVRLARKNHRETKRRTKSQSEAIRESTSVSKETISTSKRSDCETTFPNFVVRYVNDCFFTLRMYWDRLPRFFPRLDRRSTRLRRFRRDRRFSRANSSDNRPSRLSLFPYTRCRRETSL